MLVCSKCLDLTGCSAALRTKADKSAQGLRGLKWSGESDQRSPRAELNLQIDRSAVKCRATHSLFPDKKKRSLQ